MVTLGSKTEGSTVKVKENGTWVDFYVSKHNYESSLNGANRTALVRKNCFTSLNWNTTGNNAYADSTLDTWLNSSYINSLDEDLREAIGTTKLYYSANGNSGVTVLERAIFVLSATELGGGESSIRNTEGSVFPIAEILKKATSNQWSRTPYDGSDRVAYFDTSGNELSNKVTFVQGARPAFTLPSETKIDENGNVIINQPPTTPSYISFETPKAGKNLGISWGESTDPDGDTIDYLLERQVDTGEWAQIAKTSATKYTDVCPSSGTNVNYRVKANDRKGGESDYRTGTAKAIIYNQPPTAPGTPQYKYPIPGEEMPVKWQASTDPDDDPVTYVVEYQMGGNWVPLSTTGDTAYKLPIPKVIRPGDDIPITWGTVEDAESYKLQRKIDSGEWADIADLEENQYTDTAPTGSRQFTEVQYRVAVMQGGEVISGYTESAVVFVYVQGGEA